ncbi:MAG TPA: FAD-dependent oxidoreductase, partial [Planctomycetota bacterium]|nr:FAD-dependent oxidoreductase [Planctomycetota bacterium]
MKTYRAKVADLPITYDVDVLVVGGGPAGAAAAFAAAREGRRRGVARVLIVEQFNCLGGVATAGGHAHFS